VTGRPLLAAALAALLASAGLAARAAQEPEPLPPASELVPRVLSLSHDAEEALDTIAELANAGDLEPQVTELADEQSRLDRRLDEVLASESPDEDRLASLDRRATLLGKRMSRTMTVASDHLQRLDSLRTEWTGRRDLWKRWRRSLASDAELAAVYDGEISRAEARIVQVVQATGKALPPLVDLQRRLQHAERANRRLVDRVEAALASWHEMLWRRSSPVLLSAAHRAKLAPAVSSGIAAGLRGPGASDLTFESRQLWVLLFQIAFALLVGWAVRRFGPRVRGDARWSAALHHPWAVGVLVATAASVPLYGALPQLGGLALVAAVAASVCRVAAGMYANPGKRRIVYLVSGVYVLVSAFEAISLPVPLLRLVLAALAAAGVPVLLGLARRASAAPRDGQRIFLAALRLGAAALGAVLLAEVLGFHVLAQWLFEAAAATAFVGFVVSFLLRLGQGSLHAALHSEEAARIRFLERVGGVLAERLVLALKVLVVGYAALYVLSIWELVPSAAEAWSALVHAGVTVGEHHFTLGKLLLATVAVYLAFLSSWVIRALLDQTFFERRQLARGIRDSISTLLHYSVLVVGVFVALSVFGIDLSSFALVAGALGVGIGFGLQNVVNNFISGLILLFERPVRVGDVVVVGEDWGTVQKIGLRSTVILTFNGAELIVPNGDLISQKVTNWTLSTPRARLVLPISAAYGSDPARVIELLEEIGRAYPPALDDPAPMAIFTSFGESSLDFELRVWLAAFDQLLEARSELAAAIARRFAEEGIVIPFPQRDVHLDRQATDPEPRAEAGPPHST
jgi:small-conductance mechanosensitive channel